MDPTLSEWQNCSEIQEFIDFIDDGFRSSAKTKPWHQPLIFSLYTIVSTCGAIGNLLVIGFMLAFTELRSLPNYFIMNLAVSDLLLCTVCAPMTSYMVHNVFWPFGDLACRLMASAQALNLFVSTFTIPAIGLHRYCLTRFPLSFIRNYSAPIFGIVAVWLISVGLAFPYGFVAANVGE